MQEKIREHLSSILNTSDFSFVPISGGDIAEAFFVDDGAQRYFVKVQNDDHALTMLEAERAGLDAIRKTGTIKVPNVFHCSQADGAAILVMEYIESKQPVAKDYERLGLELARLHHVTADEFGLDHDNFIGSLPQRNAHTKAWISFYIRNRLIPQFQMAVSSGMLSTDEAPDEMLMTESLSDYLDGVTPSLIHGDLWSGNYLISSDGTPYLIDPAVYFGHGEVDLAMSRLFGGFGLSFYQAYEDVHPLQAGTSERRDIYQLYYLLVHLNLFGTSYRGSVIGILKRYF